MGTFLYELSTYIGYFLFMTIFMVVAIFTAKSKTAWIWYAIGAGVQLLGLLGNQTTANENGTDITGYWIVYIGLLLISAKIIDSRYKKASAMNTNQTPMPTENTNPKKCPPNMNPQFGTKWFTFYTKVRPWIACLFTLPALVDFLQHIDIYLSYWWLLLSFVATIISVVLGITVAIKSSKNYVDFVHFVKGVLIFETINTAYQAGIQQYTQNGFIPATALIVFVIVLILDYFIWYRLNIKYFEKRILLQVNSIAEQRTNPPASTSTPSPQVSLSWTDESFKKYGDFATPSNDLMVQKQKPTEEKPRNQVYATLSSTQTSEKQSPSNKALFCRKCGAQLLSDSAFCSKCGTKVETL